MRTLFKAAAAALLFLGITACTQAQYPVYSYYRAPVYYSYGYYTPRYYVAPVVVSPYSYAPALSVPTAPSLAEERLIREVTQRLLREPARLETAPRPALTAEEVTQLRELLQAIRKAPAPVRDKK